MRLLKKDKPAYLRYKRGRITEKERVERVELAKAFEEDDERETNIGGSDTSHPLWTKWKGIVGSGILVIFLIAFIQVSLSYTKSVYGTRESQEAFSFSELTDAWSTAKDDPAVGDVVPDTPDTDPADEALTIDTSISLQVQPDSSEKSDSDNLEITDSEVAFDPTDNLLAYSVSIHESLIASLERIKLAVVQFDQQQVNWINVQGRLSQERSFYKKISLQLTEQLSTTMSVQERRLLEQLSIQVGAFDAEVNALSNTSRASIIMHTNTLIDAENERRAAFLTDLAAALNALNIPYQIENDSFTF